MSNFYALIIGLFALMGLLLGIWSWRNISKAKKQTSWSSVEGEVVKTTSSTEAGDFKPKVEYRYTVTDQTYDGFLALATSDVVLHECATSQLDKYPIGGSITVYFDPENPEDSTLEPGVKSDDWFIFWLCAGALGTGVTFLWLNI